MTGMDWKIDFREKGEQQPVTQKIRKIVAFSSS